MTRKTASSGSKLALLALGVFLAFAVTASSADTFSVTIQSQTSTTITLAWSPQPGYGYLFSANGALVSRTNDSARNSVRFTKNSANSYDIDVIVKGANGHCCTVTPPPPPKNQCEDGVDNDGDNKVDMADPGCSGATDNDETDVVQPPPTGQVFLSPTGNDANGCTQAAPCRSFDRGYRVAKPGQTVLAAPGSYGSQTVGADSTKTGANVVLNATGATVDELLFFGATNLEVRGVIANLTYVGENSASAAGKTKNITLRSIDTRRFFARSVDGLGVYNSRIGGTQDGSSATIGGAYQSTVPSKNVVIDNTTFHDIGRADNPSSHVECLFAAEIDGMVIRNSVFTGCDVFDVYFSTITCDACQGKNVTITGTKFDKTNNYGLFFRADPPNKLVNFLIENNWFVENTGFSSVYPSSTFQNFVVRGNYGGWSESFQLPGITFTNNHFGQSPPAGWP